MLHIIENMYEHGIVETQQLIAFNRGLATGVISWVSSEEYSNSGKEDLFQQWLVCLMNEFLYTMNFSDFVKLFDFDSEKIKLISYLLFVIVAWDTFGEMMNPEIKDKLIKHKFITHILVIVLIFSMLISANYEESPMEMFINSVLVYAGFLILVNQKFIIFFILLVLIAVIYVLSYTVDYYEKKGLGNTQAYYQTINDTVKYSTIVLALGGFGYFNYQKIKEHGLANTVRSYIPLSE